MLKSLLSLLLLLHLVLASDLEHATPLLDGRIVGGNEVHIIDFPYQVSVQYVDSHRCGGAIIARTWILTGAHCVDGLLFPLDIRVRVGTSYLGVGGDVFNVTNVLPHYNYSGVTYDFDIALLQLAQPITLSSSARIIALPDNADGLEEDTLLTVSGWGATSEAGSASTILRAVEVPVISHSVCRDLYSTSLVSDRMLCAGLYEGGRDACAGDGGGPLVGNDSVLYGLVSWGLGCARPTYPGVYANVGVFRDWITSYTGI